MQESFGKELQYGNIYLGKKDEDCVTVEEYVEGDFDKYINNDGAICFGKDEVLHETGSAVTALQNGFKKRCETAAKGLAAAVVYFGCFVQPCEAREQRKRCDLEAERNIPRITTSAARWLETSFKNVKYLHLIAITLLYKKEKKGKSQIGINYELIRY